MEKCGVILSDGTEVEYENLSQQADTFILDPQAWIDHDGDIVAVFHTHPDGEPFLSSTDRNSQLKTGLPWVLYTRGERKVFNPVPKLLGREFNYGTQDCYSLVSDAYHLAGIQLPDLGRNGLEQDSNDERILKFIGDHFNRVMEINELSVGDVIVTSLGGKANHMSLYLGGNQILHHAYGQISLRCYLSDAWVRRIHSVWRHPEWTTESIKALEQDFI